MKALGFIFGIILSMGHVAMAAERNITIVNYETEGVKQWIPGTVVVEQGDQVNITLINNVPSGLHGFTIPDFNQTVVVKKGESQTISFKADKSGIFPINCHLHKPHVGGQFVVLKK